MTGRKPSLAEALAKNIARRLGATFSRRRMIDALDRFLVSIGWFPEKLDGSSMVLHISDTPSCAYPFVKRTLARINPSVVVHTGDLADDIKLELYPGEVKGYRERAAKLLAILEAPRRRVIITPGNHDDPGIISSLAVTAEVLGEGAEFAVRGVRFAAGHYYDSVAASDADYLLFGHNVIHRTSVDPAGRFLLNGICAMNLIDLRSRDVTEIMYPRGTDDARLLKKSRMRS